MEKGVCRSADIKESQHRVLPLVKVWPFVSSFFPSTPIKWTSNGSHSLQFPWHLDQQDMWHFHASKMCSEGEGELFVSLLLWKKCGKKISPRHASGAGSTLMVTPLEQCGRKQDEREAFSDCQEPVPLCGCSRCQESNPKVPNAPQHDPPTYGCIFVFIYIFLYFYIDVRSYICIKLLHPFAIDFASL